jgi:hypothetical protein
MKPQPVRPIQSGDYVRFAHLPRAAKPSPVMVTKILPNGMIRLLGWGGDFAPHLFVVVEGPKEAA